MIYEFRAAAGLNKGDDLASRGKILYSTTWTNEMRAAWCPCLSSPPKCSEKEPHKLLL